MLAHTVRVTTLDERTGALLERLERLCPGGGYHIFEAADLAPDSEEEIAEAICYLSDSHCVDVRYAEGSAQERRTCATAARRSSPFAGHLRADCLPHSSPPSSF